MFFDECLTPQDIAEIWRINDSTIRKAIVSDKFIIGDDCQKFGRQWVFQLEAACRVWGAKPLSENRVKSMLSHIDINRLYRLQISYC